MSNQLNHTEMIDAYLSGNLNSEDAARLMKKMEQDPALKEEFLLQKDLVHSLQNHRRNELKARLNNIEVGTGYSLPSAISFKMIAGTALVAILGTGAYFAYDHLNEQAVKTPEKELIVETTSRSTNALPEQTESKESEAPVIAEEEAAESEASTLTIEEDQPVAATNKPAIKEAPVVKKTTAKEPLKKEESTNSTNSTSAEKTHSTSAEVVKPEVITSFEEQDPSANLPEVEVPEDNLKNTRKFDTQNIEVTTKTDRRYPFHYMFFDKQLSIYGDFSKVPYEVLEVNTGTKTAYFLYHNGNYYELNPNQQKITRLKELTNEKIIRELESTRSEKLLH